MGAQIERGRLSHDQRFPRFMFRLAPQEKERWLALARAEGLSLAGLIKRCVRRELELQEALRLERERFEREGR